MAYEEDDGLSKAEKVLTQQSAAMVLPDLYIPHILGAVILLSRSSGCFLTAFLPKEALQKMPPDLNLTLLRMRILNNCWNFPGKSSVFPNSAGMVRRPGSIIWWFLNSFFLASVNTCFNCFLILSRICFCQRDFPRSDLPVLDLDLHHGWSRGRWSWSPYLMMINLGLYDSFLAIILPSIAGVFGIFLMKQYIQSMPSGLEEAARIDGCSEFGIFIKSFFPL